MLALVREALRYREDDLKTNLNWYVARVASTGGMATFFCEAYNVMRSSVRGAEFHLKVSSFSTGRVEIPTDRQASFREELLGTATDAAIIEVRSPSEDAEKTWIEDKLKSVFAEGAQVEVRKIET